MADDALADDAVPRAAVGARDSGNDAVGNDDGGKDEFVGTVFRPDEPGGVIIVLPAAPSGAPAPKEVDSSTDPRSAEKSPKSMSTSAIALESRLATSGGSSPGGRFSIS